MGAPFQAVSDEDVRHMLAAVGARSFDDLFAAIPAHLQTDRFNLPGGLSEAEMTAHLSDLASRNARRLINFCGGGFYDHFVPAAVDALVSRGEFYTAYTPYQPEASQGTLQAIYEYQTAIARLTEMEVANASLYDGGTALFEAVTMAARITERARVLVDEGVHPIYRAMLCTFLGHHDLQIEQVPLAKGVASREAWLPRLGQDVAAIVLQNPNFFGCLDDFTDLADAAHRVGALAVACVYPIALGLVKTPGAMGMDIAVGEGQSLGLPLSFGGPYLGFMATRRAYVRKMPGRLVGATQDAQGRRGFVLTLQAREQHIRREKAMSNICTNEALCALRAVIFLALLGRSGFVALARACAARAAYAHRRLVEIPGVRPAFEAPFFNEFAVTLPVPAADLIASLFEESFAVGFPVWRYYRGMENVLLVAVTEKRTREEIDAMAGAIERHVREISARARDADRSAARGGGGS